MVSAIGRVLIRSRSGYLDTTQKTSTDSAWEVNTSLHQVHILELVTWQYSIVIKKEKDNILNHFT